MSRPVIEGLLAVAFPYFRDDLCKNEALTERIDGESIGLFENWLHGAKLWQEEFKLMFENIRKARWEEVNRKYASIRERVAEIMRLLRDKKIKGLRRNPYLLFFLISPKKMKAVDRETFNMLQETLRQIFQLPDSYQFLLRTILVRPYYRNSRKRSTDYGQHYRILKEFVRLDCAVRRADKLGVNLDFINKEIENNLPSEREPTADEMESLFGRGRLINSIAESVLGDRLKQDLEF